MKCVTASGKPSRSSWGIILFGPVLVGCSCWVMQVDFLALWKSPGPLLGLLKKLLVAPDLTYFPKLVQLTVETLLIAFVATIAACLFSFIPALLAARNCTPHAVVSVVLKGAASTVRAIPDLLLALVLASSTGLGNVPGVLALTITSIAYLVKAYAEALEVVHKNPVEGIEAAGGSWLAQRTLGIVPQGAPDLIGLSLYTMDSNLRSAAILGAVGAGGIGYDLAAAIRHFQFDRLGMMILSVYASVSLVDAISGWVRRRVG